MEELEFRKKYEGREKVKTIKEFAELLEEAEKDANDYGSIVACCSLMMNAAFSLVNSGPSGGITGFQAGCLMWEMVQRYGMFGDKPILRITNYKDLLYPQYADKFGTISRDSWESVQTHAKAEYERLKDDQFCSPRVLAHMRAVADGEVPFGLRVVED
jgi:hypothetical protein